MKSPLMRPRASPAGARLRAELPSAWLPVEENWKLAEVLGGRMTQPPPPHQDGGITLCRSSGPVRDLTTSAMSSSNMEELEIWTREATTRVRGTT